jgi:hypothetical protein
LDSVDYESELCDENQNIYLPIAFIGDENFHLELDFETGVATTSGFGGIVLDETSVFDPLNNLYTEKRLLPPKLLFDSDFANDAPFSQGSLEVYVNNEDYVRVNSAVGSNAFSNGCNIELPDGVSNSVITIDCHDPLIGRDPFGGGVSDGAGAVKGVIELAFSYRLESIEFVSSDICAEHILAPPTVEKFLWKPVSERDGNLVILHSGVNAVPVIYSSEGILLETGASLESSNGFDHMTVFTHPGSYYGTDLVADIGGVYCSIANGSSRIESCN